MVEVCVPCVAMAKCRKDKEVIINVKVGKQGKV